MAKIVGNVGDIVVGGTSLKVKEWESTEEAEVLDITNKASSGWKEYQLGIVGTSGTFKADWDVDLGGSATPPFDTVEPNEGVTFVIHIGSSYTYSFTGIIESLAITSDVNGVVEYTGSFKSCGTVTWA